MEVIPFILFYPDLGCTNVYVVTPPTNKYYRYDYIDSKLPSLNVHGGITFSEPAVYKDKTYMSGMPVKPEYVSKRLIQFDGCEYLAENHEVPNNWWVIGFDTNHACDNPIIWTKEAVSSETIRLASQLEKYNDKQELFNEESRYFDNTK